MRHPALLLVALSIVLPIMQACRREPARQSYPLRGQILAIGPSPYNGQIEVTVKHEDIPGFMPGMTMAYFVKAGEKPDVVAGDLFTATLVVEGSSPYVQDLKKTGRAPLPADAKPVTIMDVMQPGDLVPDDPLQDQTGATRRLSDWQGRALAVTFVYTRCPLPDFCPKMDGQFAALQKAILADAALRERAHLASISFDPGHDTVETIKAHAAARGADPRVWSYLTGSASSVGHLTSRFGVSAVPDKETPAAITHNLRTAIVDPKGRLIKVYSGNEWTADAVLADLRDAVGR